MTPHPRTLACVLAAACFAPPATRAQTPTPAAPFEQTLGLHGISFHVTCANDSPTPTLTIAPAHLAIDNTPMTRTVTGRVALAEVADLNADGSPEIYVYVARGGQTPGTDLVAFSANRKKSLSEIVLPPVEPGTPAAEGYRGRDTLHVVTSTLVRRFPVYQPGDPDDHPTGGTRQIAYTLAQGEATWVLRPGRARTLPDRPGAAR